MSAAVKAVLVVVVLAALGGGSYALLHKSSSSTKQSGNNTPAQTSNTAIDSSTSAPSATIAATITFTDSGFSPDVTTVKAGDTVRVSNKSSQELDFDSDPHPVHSDEPELNVGPISPGESQTFTVTKTGHWGFHDHLNPGFTGSLDVE